MGSKKTTNETVLPEPTAEERQAAATFNALLDAQMSRDYNKVENRSFVYNRQAEIDQINSLLQNPPPGTNVGQLQKKRDSLMGEGGYEKVDVQYVERPEVAAKRKADQAQIDKINKQFFDVTEKVLKGDLSINAKQKAQIQQLIGDNFDPIMDTIKAEYSSSEEAIKTALDRLMESGKADMIGQVKAQETALKRQNELLGRSGADLNSQRAVADVNQSALERLYRGGAAVSAEAIAGLRGQRANTMSQAASQRGLAGYNLSLQAANPLSTFGAGAQFAQLQGALGAQQLQNQYMPINALTNRLAQMGNLRAAQPTTTQTTPFGILDVLGAGAGLAGTAFSGISAFG